MGKLSDFFGKEVKVINVGIPSFADDLKKQGIPVIHVDWKPTAGGNKKTQSLLARIAKMQNK